MKVLINSALGFDFNAKTIDHENKPILTGYKTIYEDTDELPKISTRLGGEKWFTNFDEDLLKKIINYKQLND